MDILTGFSSMYKVPTFVSERRGDKISKAAKGCENEIQVKVINRRNEIIEAIKEKPEHYTAKSLAKLLDVSSATICADITAIGNICKSTKAGKKHTFIYMGK